MKTLRILNSCLLGLSLSAGWLAVSADAQTTLQAPTFGTVINLGYTPSDIVLDQSRGYLYLVNSNGNKVDVVSTASQKLVRSILVGTTPLSAAISRDNATLYVTNSGVSTVSIIDLSAGAVVQTISLPAKPQGVAVGGDGRALVSTLTTADSLLILDKSQATGQQLIPVLAPPTASTPTQIGTTSITRPTLTWNSKLVTTPDGNFIIGLTEPSTSSTYLFVYEVASGTIIRSRTVTGQSTVLSVSPDGSRFMAGFTLYDVATLGVIAQANNANAPWTISNPFSVQTNLGGSVFSPDGTKIYSAFNNALNGTPTPPPQSSTLFINDSKSLGIQLGIRLPENILSRMVMTTDGTNAWSLSQSGVTYLPLSTLYNNPILQLQTTTVFLTQDPCNPGLVSGTLNIVNAGKGKLTFGVNIPSTGSLTYRVSTGVTPATITFFMDSGRAGETRQAGTNLITGNGTISGNPIDVTLYSAEAINVAPNIRVYMNYRQPDQRGVIYPIVQMPNANSGSPLTGTTGGNEGLWDIVLDSTRNLVYISNSGYNRVEVFDTVNRVFKNPIPVGQFPHQMALSTDSNTLYVGNAGGESISIVDLTQMAVTGTVAFPAYPRQGGGTTATPSNPRSLAYGLSGLQFLFASGTGTASQWEVIGGNATVRTADTVTVQTNGTNALPGPYQMMLGSADGSTILTIDGTGSGYVYSGLGDTYVSKVSGIIPTPITGFYVPIGVAPDGSYFTISHYVYNSSLTQLFDAGTGRNTVATFPIDGSDYVRLSTPVKASITTVPADDPRPILDLINFNTGAIKQLAVAAENPRFTLLGTTRYNVSPRSMVVDSNGIAYVITLSGLSVIPLTYNGAPTPAVTTGTKGIVNSADGSQNIKAGTFININGSNLASSGTATTVPAPTVLGGSCVTFNDVPLPLLKTAANQIVAQVPTNIISGTNVVIVHSLDTAQASTPVMLTVQATATTAAGDTGSGDGTTTTTTDGSNQ